MTQDAEKLLAEALLELKRLSAEMRWMRSLLEGTPALVEGWADSATASQSLKPEGIKNQKHLQKLRLAGAFSELRGEIRNVSKGDRPTWEYHIPKCRKALQKHFRSLKAV
jgi:hypothetical protein